MVSDDSFGWLSKTDAVFDGDRIKNFRRPLRTCPADTGT